MRCLAWLGLLAVVCSAQTFDVASIKVADRREPGPKYKIGPDTLGFRGTLQAFVKVAYEVETYQVVADKEWMTSAWYDVVAKAGGPATRAEIRGMLQALLAERFQLKLHRETRTMPAYVLSVGNPTKLPSRKTDVEPGSRGVIQVGDNEIWGRAASMGNVATVLWLHLGMPVIDQTGVEGNYDFKLRIEGDPAGVDADVAEAGTVGAILRSVRDIGLRLEQKKMPIEVWVVDSAEQPTAN